MKWLLLLVCWVLLGAGVIYGLVNGIVPHLLTPDIFPKAQARELPAAPLPSASVENTITNAGQAVRGGAAQK